MVPDGRCTYPACKNRVCTAEHWLYEYEHNKAASNTTALQQLSAEHTVLTGVADSDTDTTDTSDSEDDQHDLDADYLDEEYFDPEGMMVLNGA